MCRELSTCAIRKFNGYEFLKDNLRQKEVVDLTPIDIVYEPTIDVKQLIACYFCPQISLAFNTRIEKTCQGGKKLKNVFTKQCHYCNIYFVMSEKKMNHHLSVCTGKTGFTFTFNDGKIIDYQDNFKFLGDVPFSIYFDFEMTIGSAVFFDAKMYVVSYCIIAAFHPDLNLPRVCIYKKKN